MQQPGSRHPAASATPAVVLCACGAIAGCQTYEPQPLDLDAHRTAIERRVIETAPVEAFHARLRHLDARAPETFSFDDGLTSAEGEVVALFYNADLRHARLAAGVALATFEHAGLWEDPEFGFDGAEIISPSGPFQFGLTLSLTIPVSGRLGVEKARAGAAHEAELRRVVDAEWMTRAAVRRAWAAWTAAAERARLLGDVLAQVERIESITGRLEAAGELSRVEGRLFRVELAERRAALAQVELALHRARVELLALLGLPPDAAVTLVPGFPDAAPLPADDDVERLIAGNTDLAARRAEHRVAEEALRLEIRKQYPDITIGGGYGEESDERLLLGVSIPVPILNANRGGIAEARARRDAARATAETTFERLLRELSLERAALEAMRSQRQRYESEVVPLLTEQSAEIDHIVRLGEVDTLLLLETLTRGFDANSRLLDLRLAELEAANAVVRLLGPESASGPTPTTPTTPTPDPQRSAAGAAGGDP